MHQEEISFLSSLIRATWPLATLALKSLSLLASLGKAPEPPCRS